MNKIQYAGLIYRRDSGGGIEEFVCVVPDWDTAQTIKDKVLNNSLMYSVVKVPYVVNEKDFVEARNNALMESIMNKLSPEERKLLKI